MGKRSPGNTLVHDLLAIDQDGMRKSHFHAKALTTIFIIFGPKNASNEILHI